MSKFVRVLGLHCHLTQEDITALLSGLVCGCWVLIKSNCHVFIHKSMDFRISLFPSRVERKKRLEWSCYKSYCQAK